MLYFILKGTDMADTSPGWKRPSQIFRLKHKRRVSLPNARRVAKSLDLSSSTGASPGSVRALSMKRRNPFGKDDHNDQKKLCDESSAILAEISNRRVSSVSSSTSSQPDFFNRLTDTKSQSTESLNTQVLSYI